MTHINQTAETTLGAWATSNSLPANVYYSQARVTKDRVYLLGGYSSGSDSSNVYTAPVCADGTLGVWTTDTPLPAAVAFSQSVVTSSRVYLLGGFIKGLPSSTVYTAPVLADGTLGAWTTDTSLPTAVHYSQSVVTKDRVYLLGGHNGSAYSTAVYTAPISADGTLGAWTTSTPLPAAVHASQSIVTKDRVYLLGGYINGASSSTVYTAPISPDGTLGAWTTGTPLPATVANSQSVVIKNRVYLLGGYTNNSPSLTVHTAPINPDGTLGEWTTSNSLPVNVSLSQGIVTKDRIYLLGGVIDGSPSNAVFTAPINPEEATSESNQPTENETPPV